MGWLANIFYGIIWNLFIRGPLIIIDTFQSVINYLTSDIIFDVLFGGNKDFTKMTIPANFYFFCVIGGVTAFLLFVIQYFALMFKEAVDLKTRIIKSLKSTVIGIIIIILIPSSFFLVGHLFIFFQHMIKLATGMGADANFSQVLYFVGDSSWDGKITNVPFDFSAPDNLSNYNWIIQIGVVAFSCLILIKIGMNLMSNVFWLLCLFVISPWVVATMVRDDGKKFNEWKNTVFSKMTISLAGLLSYTLFIIGLQLMSVILNANSNLSSLAKQIIISLSVLGGGTLCASLPTWVAQIFGFESEFNNLKSSLGLAGLVAPAGKLVKHLAGFGNKTVKPNHGSVFGSNLTSSQTQKQRMTGLPYLIGEAKRGAGLALASTGAFGTRHKLAAQERFKSALKNNPVNRKIQNNRTQKDQLLTKKIENLKSKAATTNSFKKMEKLWQKHDKYDVKRSKNAKKLK